MNRLNRKTGEGSYFIPEWFDTIPTKDKDKTHAIFNKLGKLEDLEEELGCPLEVIFKAIKDGVIYTEDKQGLDVKEKDCYFKIFKINIYELDTYPNIEYYYTIRNETHIGFVLLKDYKKTWWLKEDKSE